MLKKIIVLATVAVAVGVAPSAMAAGQACVTTDIKVAGTPAPTNGTNCVDLP